MRYFVNSQICGSFGQSNSFCLGLTIELIPPFVIDIEFAMQFKKHAMQVRLEIKFQKTLENDSED